MAEREARRLLTGVVVADDAYLGGVHAGKPGRGSKNNVPFMAAVERNEEGIRGMCVATRSRTSRARRWRVGHARRCTKLFT